MFAPGNGNEGSEIEFLAQIEEPLRWHIVDPEQIDSRFAHEREVAAGLLRRSKMRTFGIRRKWTVGNSLDKKFLIAFEEELRASAHPLVHGDTATEVDTTCPVAKVEAAVHEGDSITLKRGQSSRSRQPGWLPRRCERSARCRPPCGRARESQLRTGMAQNRRRASSRHGSTVRKRARSLRAASARLRTGPSQK